MISLDGFKGLIEFSPGFAARPDISHVLFDFDGTLSLVREGWIEIMVPMFVELLPRWEGDTEDALSALAREDILHLNGKQTIYQMIQLADRIRERGGVPADPIEYKHEYLRRLEQRIQTRKQGLRDGTIPKDDLLVHEARTMLERLSQRGLSLHLASGTDESSVIEEAELLGLTPFFGTNIHGAKDDYKSFSKKIVIERLLRDHAIPGDRLLAFGDGYVEIQNTKEAGGLAVAVASDEAHNGSGRMDDWKRERLLGVGADLVVPDFRDTEALIDCIFVP